MSRITSRVYNSSWTAPAGVTQVLIQPCDSTGANLYSTCPTPVTVVPNTNYVITINSASTVFNNPNTFGSLFNWTGTGYIKIIFVE